jgi:hypothetical protein
MSKNSSLSIIWNWKPKYSVGPVKLGEPFGAKFQEFELIRTPDYDAPDQESFKFPDETVLSIENSIVESICCKLNFYYLDKNLIGLSLENLRKVLGSENNIDSSSSDEICLEYDEYYLVIFLDKQQEKVTAVSCCYGEDS